MESKRALTEQFGQVSMFRTCEQCGCCSSACPITGVHDFNIRRIVRHIELHLIDEIANTPFPWACTTCGRCETVCPNGIAILDIIRPLRSMAPELFAPEGPAPCVNGCPAGIDVPGYVRLIAQGKPDEACQLILEKVPFPGILGRVCTHPCESVCRRGEVNQPIAICALKRYAADNAQTLSDEFMNVAPDTGRRVAVVGAGPAGLTAAFHLRKKGHHVTIFEARPEPGGMMRYGIPSYRLPKEILQKEINQVLGIGIDIQTGKRLGRDLDLHQLRERHDAVFLALGLQESRKIQLEGSDLTGVLWGLDFLIQVSEGTDVPVVKDRVMVVGGGNVAVDVALTALRMGARQVTMASLESREEMPANPWEIDMAVEEGVTLLPSWGPARILGQDGEVTGVELVQCTSVFDGDGNFCPAFGNAKKTVETNQVILAIGQTTDLSCLAGDGQCTIQQNLLVVDPDTMETNMSGVFAGGEVVFGPGVIIEAIAAGKRAAAAMDRFLGGDGVIGKSSGGPTASIHYDGKRERGFADITRRAPATLPVSERHRGFPEVELSLDDASAAEEANRCLQCDLELLLARPGADQKR